MFPFSVKAPRIIVGAESHSFAALSPDEEITCKRLINLNSVITVCVRNEEVCLIQRILMRTQTIRYVENTKWRADRCEVFVICYRGCVCAPVSAVQEGERQASCSFLSALRKSDNASVAYTGPASVIVAGMKVSGLIWNRNISRICFDP